MKKVCTVALVLVLVVLTLVLCGCNNKDLISGNEKNIVKIQASYINDISTVEENLLLDLYPKTDLNNVPVYYTGVKILCVPNIAISSLSFQFEVAKGEPETLECEVSYPNEEGERVTALVEKSVEDNVVSFSVTLDKAITISYDEKLTESEKMEYAINIAILTNQNPEQSNLQLSAKNISIK